MIFHAVFFFKEKDWKKIKISLSPMSRVKSP